MKSKDRLTWCFALQKTCFLKLLIFQFVDAKHQQDVKASTGSFGNFF